MNDTKAMQFFYNTLSEFAKIIKAYNAHSYKVNLYYKSSGEPDMTEYVVNSKALFNDLIKAITDRLFESSVIYDGLNIEYTTGTTNGNLWIGATISISYYKDYSIEIFYENRPLH